MSVGLAMPRVCAIVVHFGPIGPTLVMVESLLEAVESPPGAKEWPDLQIVVVANDGTLRPSDIHDSVQWLTPTQNLGYGGGAQLAIDQRRHASDVYLILNNDVQLASSVIVDCAHRVVQHGVGIVAPVLTFPTGEFQSGAGTLTRFTKRPLAGTDPGHSARESDWVTGAVMFLSRAVAEDVRFDSSYFLGSEDIDLCLRAKRNGHAVICTGTSRVSHDRSAVIGDRWAYYGVRNRLWLLRKNFHRTTRVLGFMEVSLLTFRYFVGAVWRRRPQHIALWLVRGYVDGFRRCPSAQQGPWSSEPVVGG